MNEFSLPQSADFAIDYATTLYKDVVEKDAAIVLPQGTDLDRKKLAMGLLEFPSHGSVSNFYSFLSRFQKEPVNKPRSFVEGYLLELDMKPPLWLRDPPGRHQKSYDARYNFCLTYFGNVKASLSFDAKPNNFVIKQIQGISDSKSQLEPFRWQDALVDYTKQYAAFLGVPEVTLIAARNNEFAVESFEYLLEKGVYPSEMTFDSAATMSHRQAAKYIKAAQQLGIDAQSEHIFWPHLAFRNYDIIAQRNNFTQNEKGNYTIHTSTQERVPS